MEGFTKKVLFLNSFNTPDLSYFFLNRFNALSMFSLSESIIPTNANFLFFCSKKMRTQSYSENMNLASLNEEIVNF